jgi:molybdopterin-guanine dinucleotide biosynthesis protein A
MKTLGVVLAGGRSSRFGSDKAEALLLRRALLDHALDALAAQCDAVAVVGRMFGDRLSIPDWPAPDKGPLGGLAGALRYAAKAYDQVMSVPVDAPRLPADLRALLEPGPSCIADQPVIGLWPVTMIPTIEDILLGSGKHSMRMLVASTGARMVSGIGMPPNINTLQDLIDIESMLRQELAPLGGRVSADASKT